MRAGGYDGEIHRKQENGEGRLQLVFVAVLGASMRNCVCKGKSRAETVGRPPGFWLAWSVVEQWVTT